MRILGNEVMNKKSLNFNHNKLNVRKDAGFTLVELVVVLALFMILLGLSAMSILAWQDWSDFKKENDTARNLFVAAQNYLSNASENGELSEIAADTYFATEEENGEEQFINDCEVDLNLIELTENVTVSADDVWTTANQGTVVRVSCEAGDYTKYSSNASSVSNSAQLLFRIITPFVSDTDILNGSISLEFTLEDGQVYSCLFSDKADGFSYEETDTITTSDTPSVLYRWESYRKTNNIGFYGISNLTRATEGVIKDDEVIGYAYLNNAETLNLEIYTGDADTHDYDVSIYSADTSGVFTSKNYPVLSFSFSDADVTMATPPTSGNLSESGWFTTDVTRTNPATGASETLYGVRMYAWRDTSAQEYDESAKTLKSSDNHDVIRVILDAVDLNAQTAVYASSIANNYTNKNNAWSTGIGTTMTFNRFGVNCSSIYAEVLVDQASEPFTTNAEYTQFAKVTAGSTANSYEIANARHLWNIRYIADFDLAQVLDGTDDNGNDLSYYIYNDLSSKTFNFKLTNNIDWKEFQQGAYANVFASGTMNVGSLTANYGESSASITGAAFPSFAKLDAGDLFNGNASGGYSLKGLVIGEDWNAYYGVYDIASAVTNAQDGGSNIANDDNISDEQKTWEEANFDNYYRNFYQRNNGDYSTVLSDADGNYASLVVVEGSGINSGKRYLVDGSYYRYLYNLFKTTNTYTTYKTNYDSEYNSVYNERVSYGDSAEFAEIYASYYVLEELGRARAYERAIDDWMDDNFATYYNSYYATQKANYPVTYYYNFSIFGFTIYSDSMELTTKTVGGTTWLVDSDFLEYFYSAYENSTGNTASSNTSTDGVIYTLGNTSSSTGAVGMFVANAGTIQNATMDYSLDKSSYAEADYNYEAFYGTNYVGTFAGSNTGTLNTVANFCEVRGNHAGGLAGTTSGTVINSTNHGDVYGYGNNAYAGGIASTATGGTIDDCVNTAVVHGTTTDNRNGYAAGIVYDISNATVKYCRNYSYYDGSAGGGWDARRVYGISSDSTQHCYDAIGISTNASYNYVGTTNLQNFFEGYMDWEPSGNITFSVYGINNDFDDDGILEYGMAVLYRQNNRWHYYRFIVVEDEDNIVGGQNYPETTGLANTPEEAQSDLNSYYASLSAGKATGNSRIYLYSEYDKLYEYYIGTRVREKAGN